MVGRGWIALCDEDRRLYLEDLPGRLPHDAQPVLFETMDRLLSGSFHLGVGIASFRADSLPDFAFLVVPGNRCEVLRWAPVPIDDPEA